MSDDNKSQKPDKQTTPEKGRNIPDVEKFSVRPEKPKEPPPGPPPPPPPNRETPKE